MGFLWTKHRLALGYRKIQLFTLQIVTADFYIMPRHLTVSLPKLSKRIFSPRNASRHSAPPQVNSWWCGFAWGDASPFSQFVRACEQLGNRQLTSMFKTKCLQDRTASETAVWRRNQVPITPTILPTPAPELPTLVE